MTLNALKTDEHGFAGGYIVILALIIIAAIFLTELTTFFNELLNVGDSLATQGLITDRTHQYYEDQTMAIKFLPVIILIGLFAWGIIYAIEHRNTP